MLTAPRYPRLAARPTAPMVALAWLWLALGVGAARPGLARPGGVLDPVARCVEGSPGCRCEAVPADPARACWHPLGGLFGDGGCATRGQGDGRRDVGQCCAGTFGAVGACGACTCRGDRGGDGCVAASASAPSCGPEFQSEIESISPALAARMRGVTWKPGCPLALEALRRLTIRHWTPTGEVRQGALIVAADVAEATRTAFRRLFRHRFPLTAVETMEAYAGDDDRSMAADNTSAFNCRPITGGGGWSEHAFGRAIDINPLRNPYVRGPLVLPPPGRDWIERAAVRPGMIVDPGPVVGAFRALGWGWGGAWRKGVVDYQHVSRSGR